jgi:hypothetical protein
MDAQVPQLTLLMELDARHDELLVKLDELDKRVEKALTDCEIYRNVPSTAREAA